MQTSEPEVKSGLASGGAILICFFFLALAPAPAHSQLLQTIQQSAAVDLVAPVVLDEGQSSQNKLNLRSAEFVFFGPIDHIFDGVLNFAGHTDEGEFRFEVHEGYIGSSKLIPRSRFRVGKFLLGVGRLNQFHRHDWPFVSAPKVHATYFDSEAVIDTGAEYSILAPLPFYLDLTIGVTNGYCYGHCHTEGNRPQVPLHYFRPSTFIDLASGSGLLLGASYLGRTDNRNVRTSLVGIDGTYKRREGRTLRWLLQSEVWHRSVDSRLAADESSIGIYVYPQYGLNEQLQLGLRLDGFSVLNQKFPVTQAKQDNFHYALVPTVTYRTSEFSTLRAAYTHAIQSTQGERDTTERRFELQLVFILGAHPAHDF